MHEIRKPFRKFGKREKTLTTEEKIKNFVIRNSINGFYTKISTLPYKFEISEERAWDIAGSLLGEGILESIHDERTGEMKLCESGKIYEILAKEQKRKNEKNRENKRTSSNQKKKTRKPKNS